MLIIKIFFISVITTLTTVSTCNHVSKADLRTKEEILAGHEWMLEEVARNAECKNTHYRRGQENTTRINYDAVRIRFNKDGTGSYTTDRNTTHSMAWRFEGDNKREIRLTVDYGNSAVYHWKMVEITDKGLYATTAFSDRRDDLLVTTRYVPVQQQ